jgi:GTP cyclohydrolase II
VGWHGNSSDGSPDSVAAPTLLAPLAPAERAIGEFVAGRPVRLTDTDGSPSLVLPADGLTPQRMAAFLDGVSTADVLLSHTRAAALGVDLHGAVRIRLASGTTCAQVLALAGGDAAIGAMRLVEGGTVAEAAVELAKLARLLPAALARPAPATGGDDVLAASTGDILALRGRLVASLRLVSSAEVPLPDVGTCRFHVFRDGLGQSWTAIAIGKPNASGPVPVRLHSACLTGDVFGSLRCDCGDQLRMAITTIAARGGGMLLYLDQEGCGIGLANKMRTYRLQDRGFDTFDANTTLGFERDERRYDVAARMLALLGIREVALLTNNPLKVSGLREYGIDVVERVALIAPVNSRNRDYLDAKQRRAGHLIGVAAARGRETSDA